MMFIKTFFYLRETTFCSFSQKYHHIETNLNLLIISISNFVFFFAVKNFAALNILFTNKFNKTAIFKHWYM